jgi:broad specificity phosphatase PhoE
MAPGSPEGLSLPLNAPLISASARIVLIRHGQPHIALRPRTSHRGFAAYITDYEAAGLDPASLPPDALRDLVRELDTVFTSDRPCSHQSARALAPHAQLIADPVFAEAPLAAPPIPGLNMQVAKWAVLSRILWHVGFHPQIENARTAGARAVRATDMLVARARETGVAVLVAHGYFNWMIGRELRKRGFVRTGSHQARYWNAVTYQEKT